MTETSRGARRPGFAIFRARDGRSYEEAGVMHPEGEVAPAAAAAIPQIEAAGYEHGTEVTLLFSAPGMSLTRVWFKSGFPLPRHSHDADCLYYVTAGSLRLGTEELGPGDGFFVGADAPYAYTPGEDGVEVLEFRTADRFNIRLLADNPAFWVKALAQVQARAEGWKTEPRPGTATES